MRIPSICVVKCFIPVIYLFICLFLMSGNPLVGLFKSDNRVVLKLVQVLISEYLGSSTSHFLLIHTIVIPLDQVHSKYSINFCSYLIVFIQYLLCVQQQHRCFKDITDLHSSHLFSQWEIKSIKLYNFELNHWFSKFWGSLKTDIQDAPISIEQWGSGNREAHGSLQTTEVNHYCLTLLRGLVRYASNIPLLWPPPKPASRRSEI